MKLFIPENIYKSNLSGKAVAVFFLIRLRLIKDYFDTICVEPYDIALHLGGFSRQNINQIINALDELCDGKYIECERYGRNKYIVKGIPKYEYFAIIDVEKAMEILYNNNRAKYDIFKYYCFLMGSRFNTTKVCSYTLTTLAEKTNISKTTINSYNKFLEDKKIIYIYKNFMSGDFNLPNLYGDYEDKGLINEYAREHGYVRRNKGNADWRRSVAIKYANFVKNPSRYSEEEKFDLMQRVIQYNKEMDELQTFHYGNDYIKRKKDLSVFNS